MIATIQHTVAVNGIDDKRRVETLNACYAAVLCHPAQATIVRTPEEVLPEARYRYLMVDTVRVGLAELNETAIATLYQGPAPGAREPRRAVVLAPTQGDVRVGRVKADALELDGIDFIVEAGPEDGSGIRVVQTPNATIIAIDQLAVRIEGKGVVIDVRAVERGGGTDADVGPVFSAIGKVDESKNCG